MPVVKAILVTIITESGLVPNLQDLVKRAGATGYTIEDVAAGLSYCQIWCLGIGSRGD